MFNYLIFDLDETIYNYEYCHQKALDLTFNKINNDFTINEIHKIFDDEKKKFQLIIGNTAASHNKFIRFKKLFERCKISLTKLDEYYKIYENEFNKSMSLFPNLIDFMDLCRKNSIKMYILTNNLCRDQIQRLDKLSILDYFERVFTSEEFGFEKPDFKLYNYVLNEIGCKKEEIAMIGDNFQSDIIGSNNFGIYSFWFHKKFKINKNYTEFPNYLLLTHFFSNYFNEIQKLIKISDYIGERFDLVQAGGGNTSVKIDDIMYIKSSGINLTEMEMNKNYVGLNYNNILNNLTNINDKDKRKREKNCGDIVNDSIIFLRNYRPSIETSIHSILKRYVVHFHPIQFCGICGQKNLGSILNELFDCYCLVDYYTPGIDLALGIKQVYNGEEVIFLKNHGVIFTVDNYERLVNLIEITMKKLEDYLKLDLGKYRYVSKISNTMRSIFNERYFTLLLDREYGDINARTFFPDKLIYCGKDYVRIGEDINEDVRNYIKKNCEYPKIFYIDGVFYMVGISLKKCRDIGDVWKSHMMGIGGDIEYLGEEELEYLNNWDAEKYRKMLK